MQDFVHPQYCLVRCYPFAALRRLGFSCQNKGVGRENLLTDLTRRAECNVEEGVGAPLRTGVAEFHPSFEEKSHGPLALT